MTDLSVIIPSLDPFGEQLQLLQSTYDSLTALTPLTYEVIIVSPPNIRIPSFIDSPNLHLEHETSSSHSQALNDGICASSGAHILVLNPGDLLKIDGPTIAPYGALCSDTIYAFDVIDSEGSHVGSRATYPFNLNISGIQKLHGSRWFVNLPHQGLLIPATLHKISNFYYDTKYNIRMDYSFLSLLNARFKRCLVCYSPIVLSIYPTGGKSMLLKNRARFYFEAASTDLAHSRILSACMCWTRACAWSFVILLLRLWKP